MKSSYRALVPLAALLLGACDSATGSGGAAPVAIRMGAGTGSALNSVGASRAVTAEGPLVLSADNGELTITDLRVVVAKFELKGDDDRNPCEASERDDDCDDFNAGPLFVDVPLSGTTTVSSGALPAGTYSKVEFEVEDLDEGDDDASESAAIQAIRQQIRAEFPDWPRDASMLVVGSFRPRSNGVLGEPVPFRVFLEAEVEIELPLNPPLVISSTTPQDVTVTLDPASLFRSGTQVVNLSQFNGQVVEWEVEHGFRGEHSGHH
jgi:hypothetical protein